MTNKNTATWHLVGGISTCACAHRTADAAARCTVRVGMTKGVVSSTGERRMITVRETHTGRLVRCAGKVN